MGSGLKFYIEWDEWDQKPGFNKEFVKRWDIIDGEFDSSIFDNKLGNNVKVYILDELKVEKQDDGNYNLVRGGGNSSGEQKENTEKGKGTRKKAQQG